MSHLTVQGSPGLEFKCGEWGRGPSFSMYSGTVADGSYATFKTSSKFGLGDHHQMTKRRSMERFYWSGLERGHIYHFSLMRTVLHGLAQLQGWSLAPSPGRWGSGLGEQLASVCHAQLQPIGILGNLGSWLMLAWILGPAQGSWKSSHCEWEWVGISGSAVSISDGLSGRVWSSEPGRMWQWENWGSEKPTFQGANCKPGFGNRSYFSPCYHTPSSLLSLMCP